MRNLEHELGLRWICAIQGCLLEIVLLYTQTSVHEEGRKTDGLCIVGVRNVSVQLQDQQITRFTRRLSWIHLESNCWKVLQKTK